LRRKPFNPVYTNIPLFKTIYESKPGQNKMYYIHKDHQGSFNTITDDAKTVLERLSFDPWGKRRNPTNWSMVNVPTTFLFDRGYTGHQHLDNLGLINMNGRVYDPQLARFLSPDPFIHSTSFTQGLNRYSYVINNPLKYTDPSGYMPQWVSDDWARSGGGTGYTGYDPSDYDVPFSSSYYMWNDYTDSGMSKFGVSFGDYSGFVNSGVEIKTFDNPRNIISITTIETKWYQNKGENGAMVYTGTTQKMFIEWGVDALPWNSTDNSSTIPMVQGGLFAAGITAGASELSFVANGMWKGANKKWYPTSWGGNQWAGARANALSRAGAFKMASRFTFGVSTLLSAYEGYNAWQVGDYGGVFKSGFDITMGGIATFGGPVGMVIGGGYFLLDAIGAFDRTIRYSPPSNTIYSPAIDNTRYIQPQIKYP